MEGELPKYVFLLEEFFFSGFTRNQCGALHFRLWKLTIFLAGWIERKEYVRISSTVDLFRVVLWSTWNCTCDKATGFQQGMRKRIFFAVLVYVDDNKLDVTEAYNVDELVVSTVQKARGTHQIGAVTSDERRTDVTCPCCMSADRTFLPPMFIFKRLHFKQELFEDAPPGINLHAWRADGSHKTYSCNGWSIS